MNRLLLVDDDVELSELLVEYLQGEGFEMRCAFDGEEALRKLDEGDIDLVVLDVMLPRRNGFEVLREMRGRSATPVLMLTARGDDVDRIVGLEMGADDYLAKPCNPRELAARIRAILRRMDPRRLAAEDGSAALEVGGVMLDPASREASVAGRRLALTGAEFNVLEALLRSAGRVLSREELTRQGLGRPLERHDRSIDVHVSNLRRKLGPDDGGQPRIKSVRGVGYIYLLGATAPPRP